MTHLPRLLLSIPPDIETAIERMRNIPKFSRMPKSQVCLYFMRLGIQQKEEWTRFYEDGAEGKGEA